MKRIALALAVVALAACSKGGDNATPSTMNAAPDTTTKAVSDTSHMMMSDTSHMMMSDTSHMMMKDTTKPGMTKTPTTIPPTPKKKS
jgi:hypothetical protein